MGIKIIGNFLQDSKAPTIALQQTTKMTNCKHCKPFISFIVLAKKHLIWVDL